MSDPSKIGLSKWLILLGISGHCFFLRCSNCELQCLTFLMSVKLNKNIRIPQREKLVCLSIFSPHPSSSLTSWYFRSNTASWTPPFFRETREAVSNLRVKCFTVLMYLLVVLNFILYICGNMYLTLPCCERREIEHQGMVLLFLYKDKGGKWHLRL